MVKMRFDPDLWARIPNRSDEHVKERAHTGQANDEDRERQNVCHVQNLILTSDLAFFSSENR